MLRQAHRRIYLFAFATLAACGILVLSTPLRAQAPAGTFLSFDAPGAGTAQGQGTFPVAINRSGLIVGSFVDGSGVHHGFMRDPDGTFTVVDVPGSTGTYVTAVNSKGLMVGYSYSPSDTGFLRYRNGTFDTLNAPGTGYTIPSAMNDIGQVVGQVGLIYPVSRGFVWSPAQSFKIVSVRGYAGSWVAVTALNSAGTLAGSYSDRLKQSTAHAFLQDSAGNDTSFDAQDGDLYTVVTAINTSGQIAGWYVDANGEALPFLRDADGTISLVNVGGAQAEATSINDAGEMVGNTINNLAPPYENAFERDAAGNVTLLTLPFSNVENTAVGVNLGGRIVGSYYDSADVSHGWLMTP